MITRVYVDGFNLYYGAVKNTPYKWLDLNRLAEVLFPSDQITNVTYFTARVHARSNDPNQPQRQQAYLRALSTLPGLEIVLGEFRNRRVRLPLANPKPGSPRYVRVFKAEEKGTDVNLATRLLVDGFNQRYEQAVVVSNDSDLATPMRYVKSELKLRMCIVNPYRTRGNKIHRDLIAASNAVRDIRPTHLRQSQLPPKIQDQYGTIHKPPSW